MPHSAARVAKRTETGRPVPSPKFKAVPREVVTWNVPRRTKVLSRKRSNRSMASHHQSDQLRSVPSNAPNAVIPQKFPRGTFEQRYLFGSNTPAVELLCTGGRAALSGKVTTRK